MATTEASVAGSPAYISTVAGSGPGSNARFAEYTFDPAAQPRPGQPRCHVQCSSAADGCTTPSNYWVPQNHAQQEWLEFAFEAPLHVTGIQILTNYDGSRGAVGRGFHATKIAVQARMPNGGRTFLPLALEDPAMVLNPRGGTVKLESGVTVSHLRVCPREWDGGGIGMHVSLCAEIAAGPASIGFQFDVANHGIAFDALAHDLLVFDNLTMSQGCMQRFHICDVAQPAGALRTMHVPRPVSQEKIRRIDFGPAPERVVYAITHNRVMTLTGKTMEVLAGGGAANNNATGTAAGFSTLYDMCVTDENVYVADVSMLRRVSFTGVVTTFAGGTSAGHVDAVGEAARFNTIQGLSFDRSLDAIVCADTQNHRIRNISMAGLVTTIAGTGIAEWKDGLGTAASFRAPTGVATSSQWIFVSDTGNHALRCISPDGLVSTIAGGGAGYRDAYGVEAMLNSPGCICHDGAGRFYFVDVSNQRIRSFAADVSERISLPPSDMISTLASLCDEEKGRGNDLVFLLNKRKVFAVRSIVKSRSSYFASLIGDSRDIHELATGSERAQAREARFSQNHPQEIDITDASYEAFRAVMKYLHSDVVELPQHATASSTTNNHVGSTHNHAQQPSLVANYAVEILELAGRYKLPRLQAECERIIAAQVCPENACALFAAADCSGARQLRQLCKAFIARNFAQVRRASGKWGGCMGRGGPGT